MGAAQLGAVTAMRKIYVILSSLSLVMSVSQKTVCAESWQDAFSTHQYVGTGGQVLPYRLLKPEKIEPGQSYPLVLFLHGAGERGADNALQLVHGAGAFATPENRRKHPCFVVAPQCPLDRHWVEVDWALPSHTMPREPSVPLRLALELVDKLAAELPADKRRFYITGLSMGSFGTWDATARWPRYFAAAVPICGGDAAQAAKLRNLPIWAFHGDRDATVRPRRTTDMIDAIRKAGGTPKMTIYPGVEHDSWNRAYADPAVLDWLFAQKN
jgi:predicted peptidase